MFFTGITELRCFSALLSVYIVLDGVKWRAITKIRMIDTMLKKVREAERKTEKDEKLSSKSDDFC